MILVGWMALIASFFLYFAYMNENIILDELAMNPDGNMADMIQVWFELTGWILPAALAVAGVILLCMG